MSFQDWVIDTRSTLKPVFSDRFETLNLYRIFITIPIMNLDTKKYIGIIGTSILTEKFLARYGNDINPQFLVAYAKMGLYWLMAQVERLWDRAFFADYTQKFINHNEILNNLTRNLLAGNPTAGIYDYGKGERLTSGHPIFVNGNATFFIQVVTPTSQIYSIVNNVLSVQRIKMMISFFAAASTVAIVVLIILLRKWNIILRKDGKRRTMELEESYDEMKNYLQEVLKELKGKK